MVSEMGEESRYAVLMAAFDLHVSVAGFCNYVRDADSMSRTQRAFVAIAKSESKSRALSESPSC
jgi:hypothetical protein